MTAASETPFGWKIATGMLFVVVGIVIQWMNSTTAKYELEPLREELRERFERAEQ
jgi:hypothetical protein